MIMDQADTQFKAKNEIAEGKLIESALFYSCSFASQIT